MAAAQTIDDVIAELEQVLAQAQRDDSRIGYFTALYHKVTVQVRDGIAAGDFDDGPRMERLDVLFANRYLQALADYRRGEVELRAWDLAFRSSREWLPVVVQHLLLGMNAHINLDLGIATAQAAEGGRLEDLHDDFKRINGLLGSLVDEVKAELAEIWRPLAFLDRISGNIEDVGVAFSMNKAREAAWELATQLVGQSEAEQARVIGARDEWATRFGGRLRSPPIGRLALLLVRLGERRDVSENIQILL